MKITIEKRTNKEGDKQNIRLVYWYGSSTDVNGKTKHNQKLEQLDQYLYTNPKTKPGKAAQQRNVAAIDAELYTPRRIIAEFFF